MTARTAWLATGFLVALSMGCKAVGMVDECYRTLMGDLELEHGVAHFDGFTIERLNSACAPLADCKFDYYVDTNGNGMQDPEEPAGHYGDSDPGSSFSVASLSLGTGGGVTVHYSYEASKLLPDGSKETLVKKTGWKTI